MNLAGSTGLGYRVQASGGGVYSYGATGYGSAAGTLGTGTAVGVATDPDTGGYWILKSNGGVANYNAPWYGSLAGKVPAGQRVPPSPTSERSSRSDGTLVSGGGEAGLFMGSAHYGLAPAGRGRGSLWPA